jgi:hypothetical protein
MSSPKRARLLLTISLALGAASLAVAAPSPAFIYWSNTNDNAIGRANQDGSAVNNDFLVTGSTSEIDQIALDASRIYWTSPGNGTIGRANLDGTDADPTWISGLGEPSGLAVTSQFVYWTTPGGGRSNGAIGRASINGSGVNGSFVTGVELPGRMALGNGRLYWGSGGLFEGGAPNQHTGFAIGTVELGGGGLNQTLVGEAFAAPAVNGSNLFWGNYIPVGEPPLGFNTIGRAGLDGSAVNEHFIELGGGQDENGVGGLALDSKYIYWTHSLLTSGWIGRAELGGAGVNQSFITGGGIAPSSIAVNELSGSGAGGGGGSANGVTVGPVTATSGGELDFNYTFATGGTIKLVVTVPNGASIASACKKGFQKVGRRCVSKKPIVVGTLTGHLPGAGSVKFTLHTSGRVKAALKAHKSVTLKDTLTFTPSGSTSKVTAVHTTKVR